jgi:hypothetical protein
MASECRHNHLNVHGQPTLAAARLPQSDTHSCSSDSPCHPFRYFYEYIIAYTRAMCGCTPSSQHVDPSPAPAAQHLSHTCTAVSTGSRQLHTPHSYII